MNNVENNNSDYKVFLLMFSTDFLFEWFVVFLEFHFSETKPSTFTLTY